MFKSLRLSLSRSNSTISSKSDKSLKQESSFLKEARNLNVKVNLLDSYNPNEPVTVTLILPANAITLNQSVQANQLVPSDNQSVPSDNQSFPSNYFDSFNESSNTNSIKDRINFFEKKK